LAKPKSTVRRTPGRGDQTREALLVAALEIFGRDGFHAASTRAIADLAGVNQALIAYHFGGKEGLYLAVFESVTEQTGAYIRPLLDNLSRELDTLDADTPAGRQACLQHMDNILGGLVRMFGQAAAPRWVRLVMREQQDPTRAFDIFYGGVYSDMLGVFTRLLGLVTGQSPDLESTRVQALALLGQVLVFMVGRGTATRHLDWEQIGPDELQVVYQQVRRSLYAQFGGEIPA